MRIATDLAFIFCFLCFLFLCFFFVLYVHAKPQINRFFLFIKKKRQFKFRKKAIYNALMMTMIKY